MSFVKDKGLGDHVHVDSKNGVINGQEIIITVRKLSYNSANLSIKIVSFVDDIPAIALAINLAVSPEQETDSSFRYFADRSGPYLLSYTLTLNSDSGSKVLFGTEAIWVSTNGAESPRDVEEALTLAMNRAAEIEQEPLREEGYAGDSRYLVVVFVEGWVVGLPLHFIRGGRIEATPFQLGFENREAVVNRWFKAHNGPPVEPRAMRDAQLPSVSTITFHRVLASTPQSAAERAFEKANNVAAAMAIESGGSCELFAALVANEFGSEVFYIHKTDVSSHSFHAMMQSNLGYWLELATKASEADPWIGLLNALFLDVSRDKLIHHKIFKMWTIMESCAKKRPFLEEGEYLKNGDEFLLFNGKRIKANKDISRVYSYVFNNLRDLSPMILCSDIWSVVKAFYIFRNMIAHEGDDGTRLALRTDPESIEASKFFSESIAVITLLHWAKSALHYEMMQAVGIDSVSGR